MSSKAGREPKETRGEDEKFGGREQEVECESAKAHPGAQLSQRGHIVNASGQKAAIQHYGSIEQGGPVTLIDLDNNNKPFFPSSFIL